MITLYLMMQINYFCKPFETVDKDCANEMIQCLTDDVFTVKQCRDEYIEDLWKDKSSIDNTIEVKNE